MKRSVSLFCKAGLGLLVVLTPLVGCTGGGATTTGRADTNPVGSTSFVPGRGCGRDQALVGNRCINVNNDRT